MAKSISKKKSVIPQDSIPAKIWNDISGGLKRTFTFDKKFFIALIPLLIFAWLGNKGYCIYRVSDGSLDSIMANFNNVLINPIPSFNSQDLLAGVVTAAAMKLYLNMKKKNKKNFRSKEEYGSARWGTSKDIEPYVDSDKFENNIMM